MMTIDKYWYRKNWLIWLLLPLSWLYCLIVTGRRKLYQLNIKKSYSSELPVIIVGNIVAGGSGKTPLLIALCETIKNWGYNPGVVSRGYGGKFEGLHQVSQEDSAALVGDEPLMIFQRCHVPVVVGADRVSAINYLLDNNRCDIVLSDDGLQHYRMRRDIEIAVIDSTRRFGNGFCLPAGPLRERIARLDEVDLLVYNDTGNETAEVISGRCSYSLIFDKVSKLNGDTEIAISSLPDRTVHAIAGIAFPQRFFRQLTEQGISTINHEFPDHHVYRQDDFLGWQDECIIMTEKDAVKCKGLDLSNAWVVSVTANLSKSLEERLSSCIQPLLDR